MNKARKRRRLKKLKPWLKRREAKLKKLPKQRQLKDAIWFLVVYSMVMSWAFSSIKF